MAERDRFELDLAGALRAYVDDAPTDVRPLELVRELAATRPRGLTVVGPWRLPLRHSIVWLIVLGALLLAATTIAVGSLAPPRDSSVLPVWTPFAPLAACPPGANPNAPGPVDQARPPVAYVQPLAFDSRAGRIVAHEHETWTFDVCTNTWLRMYPAVEPPYVRSTLVYDADADRTVAIADDGHVWAYDLAANTWTRKATVPEGVLDFTRLAYDPVLGLVLAQPASANAPLEMWTYAVETDSWARIETVGAPERHERQIMAYDRSIDRVVVYDGELPATWLFNPSTSSWTPSTAATPAMPFNWAVSGGEIAYDEATRQTVAYSNGKVVAYDARADRWSVLLDLPATGQPAGPTAIGRPTIVYDSVNKRLVAYGSTYARAVGDWVEPSDVLAFDPATSQWTTLLPSVAGRQP